MRSLLKPFIIYLVIVVLESINKYIIEKIEPAPSQNVSYTVSAGHPQAVVCCLCRGLEWGSLEVTVNHDNSVDVREITTDAREHLEFHDRVVKASLGWDHLVVTTSTQAYIYK